MTLGSRPPATCLCSPITGRCTADNFTLAASDMVPDTADGTPTVGGTYFANAISITTDNNIYTTAHLDSATGLNLVAPGSVTTGNLDGNNFDVIVNAQGGSIDVGDIDGYVVDLNAAARSAAATSTARPTLPRWRAPASTSATSARAERPAKASPAVRSLSRRAPRSTPAAFRRSETSVSMRADRSRPSTSTPRVSSSCSGAATINTGDIIAGDYIDISRAIRRDRDLAISMPACKSNLKLPEPLPLAMSPRASFDFDSAARSPAGTSQSMSMRAARC